MIWVISHDWRVKDLALNEVGMSDTFWYQTGRILCGSRVSRILDHSCKTVLGGRTQIRDYQERGAFHSIYPTIDDVLYHPPQPAKSLDLLDERDQGITERTPRASPIIVLVVSLVIPYCLITIFLQNKMTYTSDMDLAYREPKPQTIVPSWLFRETQIKSKLV